MKGEGEPDEDKVASFKKQLNTNLDVYEKILSKQPYLAGDVSYKKLSDLI
jgi:glutathione S-transferase